jgi:hypothetical protein
MPYGAHEKEFVKCTVGFVKYYISHFANLSNRMLCGCSGVVDVFGGKLPLTKYSHLSGRGFIQSY